MKAGEDMTENGFDCCLDLLEINMNDSVIFIIIFIFIFIQITLLSYTNIGDVCHFQIQLRKLQLPILSPTLIPKTSRNLVILFHSTRHEDLLVLLGRLGEGESTARKKGRGNE